MSLIDRLEEASDIDRATKSWPTHDYKELDRKTVLSSSEAFQCLRQTWASKNDVPVDESHEEDWGWADRGHSVEASTIKRLQLTMEQPYEELLYVGDDQVSFVDRETKVSATPDGLYIAWDDDVENIETECMVEVKSIDPRTNWERLPKPAHITQVGIQMGLVRRLTNHRPDRCRLIYIDASQHSKMVEYVIDWDDGAALANAEKRSEIVFTADDMQTLPAEGALDGGCKLCPYKTACGAAGDFLKKGAADMKPGSNMPKGLDGVQEHLIILGRQYLSAKTREKMAKKMVDELKAEIVPLLDGKENLDVGGTINFKALPQAGRATLDRAKLEAEFGSLDEYTKVGAPSVRLTVSEV